MRKSYQPLLTTPLEIEVEGNVMAGSLTGYYVTQGEVEVEDFAYGFATSGPFADAGFEVSFE